MYLIEDFYKVPSFRWAERKRAIRWLAGVQYRGDGEGDELWLNPELREIFWDDGDGV